MRFTIGLAQIAPQLGNLGANLRKHLDYVERAAAAGVELLIFPELGLSGYRLHDLAGELARPKSASDPYLAPLLEASHKMDLIIGFPEADSRHRYYISAAYLSRGQFVHIHRKVYLPTYGVFEDARFFAPGDQFRAFDTRFGRMGMLICEDAWHISSPYLLWQDGADLIVDIAASPGYGITASRTKDPSSRTTVDSFLRTYGGLLTVFMVYVNRVGLEDGVAFWGGSTVYAPDGERIAECTDFEESFETVEIDTDRLRRARLRFPALRDERLGLVQKEIERIDKNAASRS